MLGNKKQSREWENYSTATGFCFCCSEINTGPPVIFLGSIVRNVSIVSKVSIVIGQSHDFWRAYTLFVARVASFAHELIIIIIVSIKKFSIVIGSPGAYLSRNRRTITWVFN